MFVKSIKKSFYNLHLRQLHKSTKPRRRVPMHGVARRTLSTFARPARTLAIVRPTFPTVTRLPVPSLAPFSVPFTVNLRPHHVQFCVSDHSSHSARLSSNSFLFLAFCLLTQHSVLPVPTLTLRERASGSKHVTHQIRLCFQRRCVWRVARIASSMRPSLSSVDPLSHPIISSPSRESAISRRV